MSKTAEYKGFQIYREGRKWYIPLVGYASEKAPTLKKAYEKIDKLTEVQSWNDDIQDTEPVSIDFDTRVIQLQDHHCLSFLIQSIYYCQLFS